MPTDRTNARPARSPMRIVWGLVGISVVGLAFGAFVLPNMLPAATGSLPPHIDPGLIQTADSPPPNAAAVPKVVPQVVAPAKPPVVIKPSRLPHALDAAPKVQPQLPDGEPFCLTADIDREIDQALADAKIPSSPLADDAEFLRRVALDITGTIPTYEQTMTFLLDGDPHKRARKIDDLLDSPAYGRQFARIWADLLIKRDFDSNQRLNTEPFVNWLASRFNDNKGWDAIVTAILTSSGKDADNPANLFYHANQDNNQPSPPKLVGAVGNLFMGIQLQCAECHVHPQIDKWSQKDFWGMAAFFGHVHTEREGVAKAAMIPTAAASITEVDRRSEPKSKAAKKNGEKEIKPGAVITIPDPTDNRKSVGTAKAKYFEGTLPSLGSVPYRPKLAAWLTSSKNKYFAPAAVNRMWAHFFARGVVHPIESMHPDNPASHPAVLKALAADFANSKFDLKRLIRVVCNTRAYQRTSRPLPGNGNDDKLYSRMPVKVIGARQLLDSLATATGYSEKERETPKAPPAKAKGAAGPVTLVRFFDTREYDDDLTEYAYGVPQVLRLMNTNLTNRTTEAAKRVSKAADGKRATVIEDLYLTALSRRPRDEELVRMSKYVERNDEDRGYAGVLWALLNSAEFVSNH
jgi:Protein of unknown function (DUF1549)/Protein of unknown function (DUF1553)